MKISSLEREELLNQIDFTRISEETISACRNNDLIPQQLITDAALSLCTQLRIQLNETESRLRLVETQLAREQFSYVASSTKTNSYPWREKETSSLKIHLFIRILIIDQSTTKFLLIYFFFFF